MDNYVSEFELLNGELTERITLGQLWQNQHPVMHWCFGFTCLSFGMVYMLLYTML